MFNENENDNKTSDDINRILEMFELELFKQDEHGEQININETIISQVELDYQGISKVLIFAVMAIIIVVLIILSTSLDILNENTNVNYDQETTIQTESSMQAENYLNQQEVNQLLDKIDYDQASYYISSEYSSNELKLLADIFNKLNYEINTRSSYFKDLLMASTVDFQFENSLEVDGMIGNNTLKALSKAIAIQQEDYYVRYNVRTDNSVVKEYGWNSQKVEKYVYFVSYEFDYDYDYNNGYTMYAYEVDLKNQTVVSVEGQLLEKYRQLGFVE